VKSLNEFPRSTFQLPGFQDSDTLERKSVSTDITSEYVQIFGTLELAMCYASVLFPEFMEHNGMVYRRDYFTKEKYNALCKTFKQDLQSVQIMINYFTMDSLFEHEQYIKFHSSERTKVLDESLHYLATKVAHILELTLRDRYPTRSFKMIVEQTGDLDVWGFSFFEEEIRSENLSLHLLFDFLKSSTFRLEFNKLRAQHPRRMFSTNLLMTLKNLKNELEKKEILCD